MAAMRNLEIELVIFDIGTTLLFGFVLFYLDEILKELCKLTKDKD